jgi:uncharacterized membrane protein
MTSPRDDEGTALLLTLGYAVLALVLLLVCVDATSLYLAHKRTDAVADAAALAGADGFTVTEADGLPVAHLTDEGVREQAEVILDQSENMRLVSARTTDGRTATVRVSTVWRAPVASLFAPEGVLIESTASSRTALR